jgi:hypothetical protein
MVCSRPSGNDPVRSGPGLAPRELVKAAPMGIASENATRTPLAVITVAAVTED